MDVCVPVGVGVGVDKVVAVVAITRGGVLVGVVVVVWVGKNAKFDADDMWARGGSARSFSGGSRG